MHHPFKYAAAIARRNVIGCRRLLHAYSTPKTYGWNIKLKTLVRTGKVEDARNVFDSMSDRDVVSWNTIIVAYLLGSQQYGGVRKAFSVDAGEECRVMELYGFGLHGPWAG